MDDSLRDRGWKRLEFELLRERERYNTQFALAKRANSRLDEKTFRYNLATYVAPVVGGLESDDSSEMISALFDLNLELSSLELFERSAAIRALWSELFPKAASLLSREARVGASSLTNAVYNLEREPGANWGSWLLGMEKACCEVSTLSVWLQVGQILSWTSGMAHYRESALAIGGELEGELLDFLIPSWGRLLDDPWLLARPTAGELKLVHKVGGFQGFGGPFRAPPQLFASGELEFLVSDGVKEWSLYCDGFGATLQPIRDAQIQESSKREFEVQENGEIIWQNRVHSFPELAPISSFDVSGDVIAVVSSLSHSVSILVGTAEL